MWFYWLRVHSKLRFWTINYVVQSSNPLTKTWTFRLLFIYFISIFLLRPAGRCFVSKSTTNLWKFFVFVRFIEIFITQLTKDLFVERDFYLYFCQLWNIIRCWLIHTPTLQQEVCKRQPVLHPAFTASFKSYIVLDIEYFQWVIGLNTSSLPCRGKVCSPP